MKANTCILPFLLLGSGLTGHGEAMSSDRSALTCDIRTFGAVPGDDGPDTAAIQAAIAACAGTGGRVILPAGDWQTGMLVLGSDMEFHLAAGAVLQLIPDIALYPELTTENDEGETSTLRAALYAPHVRNLVVSGPGLLEGHGEDFWDADFYSSGLRRPTLPRPKTVLEMADCENVHVRGLRLQNLPSAAIRFQRCEHVSAVDIFIRNDPRSPNTDGIQIRDTSNAFVTRADIATGDDAIVLKSTDRFVRNVIVTDSVLQSDDSGIRFGTGSVRGVQDSIFANLVIRESRYGIIVFMLDGGHHANNRFSDIRIATGSRHARDYPIVIDIDRRTADRTLGRIENLTFDGIDITSDANILVAGNPDAPIEGLVMRDMRFTLASSPLDLSKSTDKPRGNVEIERQDGSVDYARQPATFTFAHVRDLVLSGIEVRGSDDPARLDLIQFDVTGDGAGGMRARTSMQERRVRAERND